MSTHNLADLTAARSKRDRANHEVEQGLAARRSAFARRAMAVEWRPAGMSRKACKRQVLTGVAEAEKRIRDAKAQREEARAVLRAAFGE